MQRQVVEHHPAHLRLHFAGCEELAFLDLVKPVHTQTIGIVATDRDPLPPLARAFMTAGTRVNLELAFRSALEPA